MESHLSTIDTPTQVLHLVNQTQKNVFLTGKAGTGKTTLLKKIIETTHKNCAVVAPTGIAALNAGGVTIHSFFQLPPNGFLPDDSVSPMVTEGLKLESPRSLRRHFKMSALKKSVIRSLELLIIDEVSMLRADVLDAIDCVLKAVRANKSDFGGVQLLFIGDLLQLPPIVGNAEWEHLRKYYEGMFFFNALCLKNNPPVYVELQHIYRQSDARFIDLLNHLRDNFMSPDDVDLLQQYVNPTFDAEKNVGYITLTTHNRKADDINQTALNKLKGKTFRYEAFVKEEFPEKMYPLESVLELKVGAQVMFIKNDISPDKNYFNGKMAVVESLYHDAIYVRFPDEDKVIEVDRLEWQNIKYTVNESTKEIEEEVLGTFTHYPIKLAWAITVHKSQGLTFDKAVLDVSQVFAPGQAYVAFSRLRSLDGLVLLEPVRVSHLVNDKSVMEYANSKLSTPEIDEIIAKDTKIYVSEYIQNAYHWQEIISFGKKIINEINAETERSFKVLNKSKIEDFVTLWSTLHEDAQKFIQQLKRITLVDTPDYAFVAQRVEAAQTYFYEKLAQSHLDILLLLEIVKRTKRAKEFYETLAELEEKTTKAIVKLLKTKPFTQLLSQNQNISKKALITDEIATYRENLCKKARELYLDSKMLAEEDETLYEAPKKKAAKKEKKQTTEITFELWREHKTVEKIAEIRKLTPSTIEGHFVKLIQSKNIKLHEVMSDERILFLTNVFEQHPDESNSSIKEKLGDEVRWEELKMFRAHLDAI